MSIANLETKLIEKIRTLPPDKITILEDFIDFLLTRSEDSLLTSSAAQLSESAFAKIWDNPEDAEYDDFANNPKFDRILEKSRQSLKEEGGLKSDEFWDLVGE